MKPVNGTGKRIVLICAAFLFSTGVQAKEPPVLTAEDVINRMLDQYPSVKVAQIEIERSRQEFARIESQLGWVLSAQSGVSRDVNGFDIPGKHFEASAQIGRVYQSGSRVDISGQYTYDDSDATAIPGLANPSERTRLDLNYRIPVGQGSDNPAFAAGLDTADANLRIAMASQQKQIDALVRQIMNLYFDAMTSYARIQDATLGIERTRRLLSYVRKNQKLGLAEPKDVLNIRALLTGKISERDALLIAWGAQKGEINRLTGRPYTSEFIPEIINENVVPQSSTILERVYTNSADLRLQKAQQDIAGAQMNLARDAQKDRFDVVLSVGTRTSSGETISGTQSNDEWAGGARLEYQYSFERKGFDAGLFQSLLQKQVAEEQTAKIKYDLRYELEGLIEQVKANLTTIQSMRKRKQLEEQKVTDAIARYRVGRADTRELIDTENTLFSSSLAYKTRKIELARKYFELELIQGNVWNIQRLNTGVQASGN